MSSTSELHSSAETPKNCARIYHGPKCFNIGIYPKETCPWTWWLGEGSVLSAVPVGSKADKLSPEHGWASSMSWIFVTGPAFPPRNPAEWAVQVGGRKEEPSCQLPSQGSAHRLSHSPRRLDQLQPQKSRQAWPCSHGERRVGSPCPEQPPWVSRGRMGPEHT